MMNLASSLFVFAVGASAWECRAPEESNGPLPPVLPDSYHMIFEVNDILNNTSSTNEVWYDWKYQRSRIRTTYANGLVNEIVSYYAENMGYTYSEKTASKNPEDIDREFRCTFFELNSRKDTPFLVKNGRPLQMVDIYQAMLFGGKYQYAFVKKAADRSSMFIETNRFTTCITDRITKMRLNVTYHWTTDRKSPVVWEIIGGKETREGEIEPELHQFASVVQFDRDPLMRNPIFEVPRDIYCKEDPRVKPIEEFPQLSMDFAWREEVQRHARDENGAILNNESSINFRDVVSSQILRLAKLEWVPSTKDDKVFQPFVGRKITVIIDIDFKAFFIVSESLGQCSVVPMNANLFLVKPGSEGSFDLRDPLDLLGMTKPHVLKGKHVERGIPVVVYSRLDDVDAPDGTIILHETTFRSDEALSVSTNGAFSFAPVSQIKHVFFAKPDGKTKVYETVEKTSYFAVRSEYVKLNEFAAQECLAGRKRRNFHLIFSNEYQDVIVGNGIEFLNQVRRSITRVGILGTMMRVQQLERIDNFTHNTTVVSMVLLEPFAEFPLGINTTVDQARDSIVEALNKKQIAIPIQWQGTNNIIVPDSFVEIYITKAIPPNRTVPK